MEIPLRCASMGLREDPASPGSNQDASRCTAGVMQIRMFIGVLLPAPFSPTTALDLALAKEMYTPSSAWTPGNLLLMWRAFEKHAHSWLRRPFPLTPLTPGRPPAVAPSRERRSASRAPTAHTTFRSASFFTAMIRTGLTSSSTIGSGRIIAMYPPRMTARRLVNNSTMGIPALKSAVWTGW